MTEPKEYSIGGSRFLLHNGRLYVECPEAGISAETPAGGGIEAEAPEKPRKYAKKAKAWKRGASKKARSWANGGGGKSAAGKSRTCKICGKPGHISKTCSERKMAEGTEDERLPECGICGMEHEQNECPEVGTKVRELREKGLDSLRIAATLKVRLRTVQDHLADADKEEEGEEVVD